MFLVLQHFQNEASVPEEEDEEQEEDQGGVTGAAEGAGSLGGLEREGEFGAGLALPQDDFLLLLLLLLPVLLQLHALLVDFPLLLHDAQLVLGLVAHTQCQRHTGAAESANMLYVECRSRHIVFLLCKPAK